MKNNNTMYVTLKFLTLAAVFSMAMTFPLKLMAATWTLGTGTGECYKDDKRVGGAKYCHNCTAQQGNQVKWKFEALCDGKLAGHIEASLHCGKKLLLRESSYELFKLKQKRAYHHPQRKNAQRLIEE